MRLLGAMQGLRHVLELAIEFMDDVVTGALGGVALLFGEPQSLGGAFAQRLGAGFGLARLVFDALEELGGLLHQVERRRAAVLRRLPDKIDDVFVVLGGQGAGRKFVAVVPEILTKLLVCAVRHLRETLFRNAGAKKVLQTW